MIEQGTVNWSIQKTIREFVWNALDWIYPPSCCGCGIIGSDICPECFSQVEIYRPDPTCKICGGDANSTKICPTCSNQNPRYDRICSWGIYSGILKLIIQEYKFNRRIKLADFLIDPLVKCIVDWNPVIDIIVPVALSKQRMKTRGYNQSAIIAKMIAERIDVEFSGKALIRMKNTKPQVSLSAKERCLNVVDAFSANLSFVKGKNILLVDDIITTGATINECTKALKNSGANKVYVFTIARTKNQFNL